ncbi:MAG: EamA family transporter [Gammaproteobacteria bacterium]|nr:EamA family transporter [Gammaproteobacteria bacterium]
MALALAGALGFSAKAVLVKLAYQYGTRVDAVTIMTVRMLLALPFFLFVALWAGRHARLSRLILRDKIAIFVLGFLGYYLASYLDFSGLAYISAGLERMILFVYPTLVVVILAVVGRSRIEVITTVQIVGMLMVLMGVVMVGCTGSGWKNSFC